MAARSIDQSAALRTRAIASAIAGSPAVVIAVTPLHDVTVARWTAAVLACSVAIIGAISVHANALRALRRKRVTPDSLASVGLLSAACWTLYALIRSPSPRELSVLPLMSHGEDATSIVACTLGPALILYSRYIERRARSATGADLRSALPDVPETCVIEEEDGQTTQIPTETLCEGTVCRVEPGELVPADGRIVSGSTTLECATMSADDSPLPVAEGAFVLAGAKNTGNTISVLATAVGFDKAMPTAVRLAASSTRPATIALGGTAVAGRSLTTLVPPVALVTALLVAVGWTAAGHPATGVNAGIAVLLLTCPSAVELGSPLALLVGASLGVHRGLLLAGTSTLTSQTPSLVFFAKTGTLTTSATSLAHVHVSDTWDKTEHVALSYAAAVEEFADHPYAAAIGAEAKARHVTIPAAEAFVADDGLGVRGNVVGHRVQLGKPSWFDDDAIPDDLLDALRKDTSDGLASVFMSVDGAIVALFTLSEPLQPFTRNAMANLSKLGLTSSLLTADSRDSAQALAQRLGIDGVIADHRGQAKATYLAEQQDSGFRVAMVAEAAEDRPALEQADLGISVGAAKNLTESLGDVTILGHDLRHVPTVLRLTRHTTRTIRNNLRWGIGFHVIGLPLAAAGLLHPVLAAALMLGVLAAVIANSLRLKTST